jgi:rhodanese-related sulfurtransferase
MASQTQRGVTEIGVYDVYNLPITEGFLLLDVRPEADYLETHLVGAWRCDSDIGTPEAMLTLLQQISDEDPPDLLSTVVVCCLPGQDVSGFTGFLQSLTPAVVEAALGDSAGLHRTLCHRLATRLELVAVFDGITSFAEHFPFFVVAGESKYLADGGRPPTLPALVAAADPAAGRGALFVGSEMHASNAEAFQLLGIGAVVNATIEITSYFEDAGGVVYHRCPIEDSLTQPLAEAFCDSQHFIRTRGCGAGVATLVHCSRGRNRSAALVAHHLVRSEGMTPDAAIERVRHCRPGGTLSNEAFVRQLQSL